MGGCGPMSLTLTVLGCAGSYPGPGDACTGYLLDDGTTKVWLDCGPGTLSNLQRHCAITEVDAVIVTHHHPDHWLDLPVLRNALRYYLEVERFDVYAPAETWHAARQLIGDIAPTFTAHVIADGGSERIGTMEVRFARTDHPVETLAARIDAGGTSIAFTADTGPAFSLSPLGAGIAVVLAEATLATTAAGHVHLTGAEAGALAAAAGAGRLLLTHLPPGADAEQHRAAAATTFDGPIEVVATNERYHL